jgi:hypothetical protein
MWLYLCSTARVFAACIQIDNGLRINNDYSRVPVSMGTFTRCTQWEHMVHAITVSTHQCTFNLETRMQQRLLLVDKYLR